MFIGGNDIGRKPNRCFIPMLMHDNFASRAWIVGSLVLNHYYTVFDMTPEDERGEGYIQVGLGERN